MLTDNDLVKRDLFAVHSESLRADGGFIQIRADLPGPGVSADRMLFGGDGYSPKSRGVIWRSFEPTARRDAEMIAHLLGSEIPWRLVYDHTAMAALLPAPWQARYMEAVEAVTGWWAGKLARKQQCGRHGESDAMALGLESMARDAVLNRHGHPTDAELARFRSLLAFAVICERHLMVDYDPCQTLGSAFGFATGWRYGSSEKLLWPFKTTMLLLHREQSVAVSDGYGVPWETMWQAQTKEG